MSEEEPIWRFEKVELFYLRPIMEDEVKSNNRCHASIDFGFFIISDIGIRRHNGEDLSWGLDFGWSSFHFKDSFIDNPYGDEVRKLEMMVKNELENKKSKILDYLDDPNTMPLILRKGEEKDE